MYIAATNQKRGIRFFLRESCRSGSRLTFRDLADLGDNPGAMIKYPGGNAFYFDEDLEYQLTRAGVTVDDDHLEDLFWPWLRPDIRRAVETFRGRSGVRFNRLTKHQKEKIASTVHPFDKRRAHYLKFGTMDQGPVGAMPAALFKRLPGCCRDEIEQQFIRQETALKPHELKSYVYTIFDLQSYFQGFLAKKMPHVLDQQKVDAYFIRELCRMNRMLFKKKSCLDDYMIRYVIMFFDYHYANTTLLDEMAKDFMYRHHFHRPAKEKPVPVHIACTVFRLNKKELKTITRKQLTRIYRNIARQVHPDKGGSNDRFVELNRAYKTLLEKIKPGN